MNLEQQNVWVVGASSGIGAAVAGELLRRGANVAISARREDELEAVSGGRMTVAPLDVTDAESVTRAAASVRAALGELDLVIISAGTWKQTNSLKWDHEVFSRHVDVNLKGLSAVIAAVLPQMLARGSGGIAGIASVAGYRGLRGSEAYGATKAAQINLLEALRAGVRRKGVHVTTICPGFVKTDMTDSNRFPMPFIISAERAATSICDGLERERNEIVFPWRMAVVMKLARLVPVGLWARLAGGRG